MKTYLTLLLFCCCFTTNAQKRTEPFFGLKAGINFATLNSDGPGEINTRTALHVGALAHIHLSKMTALQPELLYSRQGAKYPGNTTNRFNYLNLPVNLQYMFDNGFRIQTGPQLGFILAAKSETGTLETDIKNQIKSLDFSWTAGVGFLFPNGFGIDARYNFGISDITKASGKTMNNVLQTGVFYQIRH